MAAGRLRSSRRSGARLTWRRDDAALANPRRLLRAGPRRDRDTAALATLRIPDNSSETISPLRTGASGFRNQKTMLPRTESRARSTSGWSGWTARWRYSPRSGGSPLTLTFAHVNGYRWRPRPQNLADQPSRGPPPMVSPGTARVRLSDEPEWPPTKGRITPE